jgi:2'-hydroxyisoflavone reductase
MKLLILGGTVFLGRHIVEAALARGHEVTLFNRGQHNPELFPNVEKLRGDRDGNLAALIGRRWEAVVDTCGYVPRIVRASAWVLAPLVEHYTFVSSLSVYADTSQPGLSEGASVGKLEDENVEQVTGETYGPLKALCEQAVEEALPGRALHVRAGLIVGPHDPTDRFTYWPVRLARGGDVLAPGNPESPVQFVDVRDLSGWIVRMAEVRQAGVYNATGPDYALPLRQFLETCRAVSGSDARLVWVDESFVLEQGVQPWMEMPLWIPDSDPQAAGFSTFNCDKAIAAGLAFRPLADTVRDTLDWAATRPADHSWRAGLKPEREAEVLQAHQGSPR